MRKQIIYLITIGLLAVAVIALAACGGAATQAPTPEPTKIPPTLEPSPTEASTTCDESQKNPFDWNDASAIAAGKSIFTTNCVACHGADAKGAIPGAPDFSMMKEEILEGQGEHWCTIANGEGAMPSWKGKLTDQEMWQALTYIVSLSSAPGEATATEQAAQAEVARPSNEGGPGDAINLTGDAAAGEKVYSVSCVACHGDQGKGGIPNAGSDDGEVPPLNPIDETLINKDAKVYATNLDLFIEHGSTPEGDSPEKLMLAFGDLKLLTPQQIADVIAYIMSLNPPM